MSLAGIFLMNGVDIRLKNYLSPNLLINAADETANKCRIETARLYTHKILLNPDALFSLNKSLISKN